MPSLRPFISYYGGKWRAAHRYPPPAFDTIIEPFAGGAGYATRYHDRRVILVERNPKVAAVWRYMISADPDEILSMPDIGAEGIDEHSLTDAQRWLIGFWLNSAVASPCRRPSKWMRSPAASLGNFWGAKLRSRLAEQVTHIRHWQIIEGDYTAAPDIEATWYIDPPYSGAAGRHYPYSEIDYATLARWCTSRRGQAIVCENAGADWLPFQSLGEIKATPRPGGTGRSHEAVWLSQSRASAQQVQMEFAYAGYLADAVAAMPCEDVAVGLVGELDPI